LVYRLDRLTRSVFDLYKLLETFDKFDCKFKSATEVYDTTTAMGRMFITIVAALAQWERENMGERMAMGRIEKARQGKWTANQPPYGYDLNREESKLYINHEEAFVVRKIFELYQTKGMSSVAKRLNDKGIYTRTGKFWSENTIMRTLRNPAYCGYVYWDGETYKGHHEPIIKESAFDHIKEIAKQRKTSPGRSVSSPYIFSLKIKCASCGRSLVGNTVTSYYKNKAYKHLNYRCRERQRGMCSDGRNVSETRMEKAFIEFLENIDFEDKFNNVPTNVESDNEDIEQLKISLEKTLDKIESRKRKWQYAWSEDAIDFDDFKKRMEEEKQKEEKIKEELEGHEEEDVYLEVNKEQTIEVLKEINTNWNVLDRTDKKQIVSSIIKEIHYSHGNNEIIINDVEFI